MTNRNPPRSARLFVLAGPTLALPATICSLANGSSSRLPGAVWFCAALLEPPHGPHVRPVAGVPHRDWSAFTHHELPDGRSERLDWTARTGRSAWRRDV